MRKNSTIVDLIKISRLDHWPKQIFMIPGFMFFFYATNIDANTEIFFLIFFSILCTSLIASSNYVINEYLDSNYDKHHPLKKKRVLVFKKIKLIDILIFYIFLVSISFFISHFLFNKYFMLTLISFVVMGIIYNVKPFRSKDLRVIDILTESINNPIRFILAYTALGGGFDVNLYVLISYWSGGAFLMTCKRYAEKKFLKNKINIIKYRPSIAKYDLLHLLLLIFIFAIISEISLFIFLSQINIINPYFSLYFIFLFIFYFFFSTNKKGLAQTPEKMFFDLKFNSFLIIFFVIFYLILVS